MKVNQHKIKVFVKCLYLILVFIFLGRFLWDNYDTYKVLDITIEWKIFSVAMVFNFIYKVFLASLWHYITVLNHCNIGYLDAIIAYFCSILGKYIPGKVFMLAARVSVYEKRDIPVSKVAISFLLENICTLFGAAFLFIISLFFFSNSLLINYRWSAGLLIILFLIVINPGIMNCFLGIIGKLLKKRYHVFISYQQMLKVVLLFILNWIILGIGFYMLICSIYPIEVSLFLYTSGVFGLSIIIGILAIFAPSGMGIREGILIVGLSVIMPQEYAVIISVVSRLWMTISELAIIGIAWFLTHNFWRTSYE